MYPPSPYPRHHWNDGGGGKMAFFCEIILLNEWIRNQIDSIRKQLQWRSRNTDGGGKVGLWRLHFVEILHSTQNTALDCSAKFNSRNLLEYENWMKLRISVTGMSKFDFSRSSRHRHCRALPSAIQLFQAARRSSSGSDEWFSEPFPRSFPSPGSWSGWLWLQPFWAAIIFLIN